MESLHITLFDMCAHSDSYFSISSSIALSPHNFFSLLHFAFTLHLLHVYLQLLPLNEAKFIVILCSGNLELQQRSESRLRPRISTLMLDATYFRVESDNGM